MQTLSRKTINAQDISKLASIKKTKSKRVLNDILYYLRKLLKLARTAQQLQLLEGVEYDSEYKSVVEELDIIKEEVDRLENEI